MTAEARGGRDRPGYAEDKEALMTRLSRIEGQVGGIARMIEQERYCIDLVTQISAAQGALNQVALKLLADHTRNCILGGKRADRPRQTETEELIEVVGRLLGSRRS